MLLAQRTHGVGQGGTDRAALDAALDHRRELGRESIAAGDPGLGSPEQVRHSRQAEVVVFVKRADDARLVHGSGRARRGVRAEQQELKLRRRTGALHDSRDSRVSAMTAASEPLEPVDDFERAVLLRDDADRQLGEGRARLWRRTAQRGQARAQKGDGDLRDHE